MDTQKLKVELLKRMIHVTTDVLGDIHSTTGKFGFYDFQDNLNLKKEDYEQLLKNMRQEKLIKIELNGYSQIGNATISATSQGAVFLMENQ